MADDEQEKVKPKPRKTRTVCYDANDDPHHVCSPDHVRVPAHCRLKRFRRKPKEPKTMQIPSVTQSDSSFRRVPPQNKYTRRPVGTALGPSIGL